MKDNDSVLSDVTADLLKRNEKCKQQCDELIELVKQIAQAVEKMQQESLERGSQLNGLCEIAGKIAAEPGLEDRGSEDRE